MNEAFSYRLASSRVDTSGPPTRRLLRTSSACIIKVLLRSHAGIIKVLYQGSIKLIALLRLYEAPSLVFARATRATSV